MSKKLFAVVKTGGKQYIVEENKTIDIEKIEGETGASFSFDSIFLVANDGDVKVGAPKVEGAKVEATIKEQFRGEKVEIQKFKRKTGYRRRNGHRQSLTKVLITKISA